MKRRPYGKTGVGVTPIGLGTIALGRSPRVESDDQAIEIVRGTFEAGVNFIDTAPLYGDAERRLGLALRELADLAPDDLVINTKAGYRPDPFDYSEEQTVACVQASLDVLGRDFIQFVHIHDVERSDLTTVMNGAAKALHLLKDDGVIGHVGVAGGPVDLLMQYIETGEFDSVITHNRYNLLDRPAAALIDRAHELGVGIVNAAPFASGILAQPDNAASPYVYHEAPNEVRERLHRIARLCADQGVEVASAAVKFSVRNDKIGTTILGAASADEIQAAVRAAEAPIDEELWRRIEREAPPNTVDNVEEWRSTGIRSITL